ncbi:MAG: radical SAM protein [Flavobacteriales bacterium]|nr:radical SAM protein [Flavobacteriales bacterium]
MPLALIAIASAFDLEKYNIVIIDGRIEKEAHEKVLLEVNDALCFGVTALTGKPIKDALTITQKVKNQQPNLTTIWGGWHTSLFPTQTLKDESSIDITVQAQGENTFKEIVAAIENKTTLKDIKGICYRDENGKIIKNFARPIQDMNELPQMNYDLVDVEAYFKKKGNRQFDYISSTGCFFRCTFCADPQVFQRKFSAYDANRIGEDIAYYHQKYQFTDLNFQDETLFTYKERIIDFANILKDKNINITWAGTMRADQGNRMTDEEFKFLASAGMRRILVGVESGSQEMMDWLKKDIKMEHVDLCAERCKKHEISVIFPFIIGFPDESEESFQKSIDKAYQLGRMSPKFQTPIFYFKPYPGTAITDDVVRKGYELPQTLLEWSDFDYIGSSGPWVSKEKYDLVENFKFYSKVARNKSKFFSPLKRLAKYRLKKKYYKFPIDKNIIQLVKREQKLS